MEVLPPQRGGEERVRQEDWNKCRSGAKLIWIFKATCDKCLYGTGISGLMLIPVTHPTQCVAECAKCGYSGKVNTTWGPSASVVHRPNGPQFNMAVRITSEHTYAQNARARIQAVHVIGLLHKEIFDTQANHHTPFDAPRCVRIAIGIGVGIGCAMAAERWVWANEISVFFLRGTQGIRTHTHKFHFGMINIYKTASPRAIKALITNVWL